MISLETAFMGMVAVSFCSVMSSAEEEPGPGSSLIPVTGLSVVSVMSEAFRRVLTAYSSRRFSCLCCHVTYPQAEQAMMPVHKTATPDTLPHILPTHQAMVLDTNL